MDKFTIITHVTAKALLIARPGSGNHDDEFLTTRTVKGHLNAEQMNEYIKFIRVSESDIVKFSLMSKDGGVPVSEAIFIVTSKEPAKTPKRSSGHLRLVQ